MYLLSEDLWWWRVAQWSWLPSHQLLWSHCHRRPTLALTTHFSADSQESSNIIYSTSDCTLYRFQYYLQYIRLYTVQVLISFTAHQTGHWSFCIEDFRKIFEKSLCYFVIYKSIYCICFLKYSFLQIICAGACWESPGKYSQSSRKCSQWANWSVFWLQLLHS